MNKKLRFSLLMLLMAVFSGVWAQEVTYDFTGSGWTVSNGQLTNGTVTFTGQGGANFKMNDGYFMMGKSGAYLTFPTYDFKVEKIEIDGRSGASAAVVQNIFVGNDAVSTATTGATGTNTYVIDTDYQDAGTFTLKVTSNHNTQITAIRVYKVADTRTPVITGGEITPTSLIPGQEGTFEVSDVTLNGGAAVHWASSDEDVIYVDEETGEFIAGDAEGDATISVTYVANDQTNYSDVTITAEVFVVDSREAIATINSFPYMEMTVNTDYLGLTADLKLAEGVSEGDYEVTFETESDLLVIEDGDCYVSSEAGTAVITVTVTPTDETTYKPVSRDFTITIVDPNAPGTENNPFTVAEAIEFIDGLNGATSSEVYAEGIVCQVDNISSSGQITYWISDDGTTDNKFEVYKGKSFNGAAFQAVTDLAVGDEVTVAGNMKKYNSTYEFDQNSRLVALVHREPVVTINSINPTEINTNKEGTFTVDLTPADNTLVNGEDYEVTYSTESDLITLDADGSYLTGETAGSAVITVTVTALDSDTYNDVTKDFTVNIIAPVQFVDVVNGCGLYQKVTSNDQLVAGHRYLIVYDGDAPLGEGFEVFNGVSNKLGQVTTLGNETNFANHIIDARDAAVSPVVLQAGANDTWYMQNGEAFINYHGSSNEIYTSDAYYTEGNLWTIDVEGDYFITNVANNDRSIRYNYNQGNSRFACYKSTSNMKDVVLYVELEEVPELNLSENDTEQQDIESGVYPIVNFTYSVKAGWNTVAMPFEGVSILNIMSDAKVYEFTGLSDEGDLNFSEFTGEFEAGKPYVYYAESGTQSNEYVFNNVNVIYEMGFSNEYFISTLYRMSMAGLYGVVPSTGQIKKGGSNSFIKGFRGYFDLPAAGEAANAIFHNADGTTTSIKAVELLNDLNGDVYDLSGRKVNGTLQPGVYVKDGKKVVVK